MKYPCLSWLLSSDSSLTSLAAITMRPVPSDMCDSMALEGAVLTRPAVGCDPATAAAVASVEKDRCAQGLHARRDGICKLDHGIRRGVERVFVEGSAVVDLGVHR